MGSAGGAEQPRLTVEIGGPGEEEIPDLLRHLARELDDLPLVVTTEGGEAGSPSGAKGLPADLVELLSIRMILTRQHLQKLLTTVNHWVARQRAASVKVTLDGDSIELTGATSDQIDRLVDVFVDRHAQSG